MLKKHKLCHRMYMLSWYWFSCEIYDIKHPHWPLACDVFGNNTGLHISWYFNARRNMQIIPFNGNLSPFLNQPDVQKNITECPHIRFVSLKRQINFPIQLSLVALSIRSNFMRSINKFSWYVFSFFLFFLFVFVNIWK